MKASLTSMVDAMSAIGSTPKRTVQCPCAMTWLYVSSFSSDATWQNSVRIRVSSRILRSNNHLWKRRKAMIRVPFIFRLEGQARWRRSSLRYCSWWKISPSKNKQTRSTISPNICSIHGKSTAMQAALARVIAQQLKTVYSNLRHPSIWARTIAGSAASARLIEMLWSQWSSTKPPLFSSSASIALSRTT